MFELNPKVDGFKEGTHNSPFLCRKYVKYHEN